MAQNVVDTLKRQVKELKELDRQKQPEKAKNPEMNLV